MKRGGKRRRALGHDEPFRTCVGTRQSAPREALLRFVRAPDGTVGFDVTASMPHRGAWTLPTRPAVKQAVERGAFARAFGAPVLVGVDALIGEVERVLEAETLKTIGLLRRVGGLVCGRTEVREALERGDRGFLLLARDLAERSRHEALQLPAEGLSGPTMASLGEAAGRAPFGVALVTDHGRLGARLKTDLRRLAQLNDELPWVATGVDAPSAPAPTPAEEVRT